jgi:hypothetical protein
VSDNKKGFGGLGNLVSDISEDIAPQAPKETPKAPVTEQKQTTNPSIPTTQPHPTTSTQQSSNTGTSVLPPETSGNSAIGWVIGIVAAVSVLIMFSSNDNKSSANNSPSYAEPVASVQTPVQTQPTQPSFDVQKPSVGENQVLNTKEVRYCTLEKVRLDAIEAVVSSSNSSEIRQFNARIADYNSRCGSFRYRRGELERIQSEINQNRAYIENTAKSEWVRQSIGIDKPAKPKNPESTTPKPVAGKVTTQNALKSCTLDQECPGNLFCMSGKCAPPAWATKENWQSEKTKPSPSSKNSCTLDQECPGNLFCMSGKCAPPAWQREEPSSKQPAVSKPVKSTIPANSHLDYSGHDWTCNNGYRQQGNSCVKLDLPANARIDYSGHDWTCNSGYRQSGNLCVKIELPLNARVDYSGHDWTCNNGYRQQGNSCIKVDLPANARIDYSGHDWTCNNGFRQLGNSCVKVEIPLNARIDYSGHDWTCNNGYRQSGNTCLKVEVPRNAKIDYSGHDWTCKDGYRQSGNECLPIFSR